MSIDWAHWLQSADPVDLAFKIATLAVSAAGLFVLVTKHWLDWLQGRRARRDLERSTNFYTEEQLERSTRYYVRPDCADRDPSNEDEPNTHFPVKQPLFDVLDNFLSKKSDKRHLLLLADSGMGKSSCLINYYVRNRKRWGKRRHRIVVVPLGIPDAEELIEKVDRKHETVLFLDAFDEDTEALADHRGRLQRLMELSARFRRVVLTCRTQFFLSEAAVPQDSGILRSEPRKAGEASTYELWKLYLLPLDEAKVDAFLKKRFGLLQWKKHREAQRWVAAVPSLSVRPMLLAFIPDLLESEQAPSGANRYDLYGMLVKAWYEREKSWVEPSQLKRFSEQLAVDLYARRSERRAERISAEEIAKLAKAWEVPLEGWKLTGRSLLNRDAAGNFKFAHRSVMEYLVASQIIDQSSSAREIKSMTDEVASLIAVKLRRDLNEHRILLDRESKNMTRSEYLDLLKELAAYPTPDGLSVSKRVSLLDVRQAALVENLENLLGERLWSLFAEEKLTHISEFLHTCVGWMKRGNFPTITKVVGYTLWVEIRKDDLVLSLVNNEGRSGTIPDRW